MPVHAAVAPPAPAQSFPADESAAVYSLMSQIIPEFPQPLKLFACSPKCNQTLYVNTKVLSPKFEYFNLVSRCYTLHTVKCKVIMKLQE